MVLQEMMQCVLPSRAYPLTPQGSSLVPPPLIGAQTMVLVAEDHWVAKQTPRPERPDSVRANG